MKSPGKRAKRIRVMHFLESGGLYGAESVVLNLSREMQKSREYQPVVACIVQRPSDRVALADKALEYGMEVHKIVVSNRYFPYGVLRFALRLRELQIDLLHSHGYKASIIGAAAWKLSRVPVLPTCHLWFWSKSSPLKFRLMTRLEIFLYRYFPAVTVVSKPIKQTLVDRGVPPERIRIIPNGIDLGDFSPIDLGVKEKVLAGLGIEPGTSIIINLGRLTEQKAHRDIIRAAQRLKYSGLNFAMLIVGDGELRRDLEEQIEDYRLANEVRLLGFRNDAKLLLQISDVFLLPSLDEGLPISLLEAMAARVPVVATPVGEIPSVLQNRKSGSLVPVSDLELLVDELKLLILDANLRAGYQEKAYATVSQKYSSKYMFECYHNCYQLLLGFSRSRG